MTPRHPDCAETFRHLDDYLDRELSAEEVAAVEGHLVQCADCADEFAVERELLECIREKLAHLQVPPTLMARIAERLARE